MTDKSKNNKIEYIEIAPNELNEMQAIFNNAVNLNNNLKLVNATLQSKVFEVMAKMGLSPDKYTLIQKTAGSNDFAFELIQKQESIDGEIIENDGIQQATQKISSIAAKANEAKSKKNR